MIESCNKHTPSWFVGHWRDWHRGHSCDKDDGKPRTKAAIDEIEQHSVNERTGFLTDAELSFLRAATTSGNTALVRVIDELAARRARTHESSADFLTRVGLLTRDHERLLADDELLLSRIAALSKEDWLIARAYHELIARRSIEQGRALKPFHAMKGPPGYCCACGVPFNTYASLAEHVRRSIDCPRCNTSAANLRDGESFHWSCGHWIARNDASASIRADEEGTLSC